MGLRINQNIAAMNAYRNLSVTDGQMNKSLEKLSSGFRINRAADDAAGLSISEGLRSQVNGMKVATRNAQDGISVVQTAEGALSETQAILQRMRDLAVQAANGGAMDSNAQSAADTEFQQLGTELDRIANTTKFGNQSLLGGSYSGAFQVGSDNTTGSVITVDLDAASATSVLNSGGSATTKVSTITGLTSAGLKVDSATLNLNSTSSATTAIDALDAAIKDVSTVRATLGAYQNRFEHTINNLNTAVENLSASESRIRDTDMAQEMMSLTKNQILSQAGTAMLAQANQSAQSVMKLLQ
jgi:flagellin